MIVAKAARWIFWLQSIFAFFFIIFGKTYEKMALIKPLLSFWPRVVIFFLILSALILIIKEKRFLGIATLIIADTSIFIDHISINKGFLLNTVFSYWDALLFLYLFSKYPLKYEKS